MLDKIQLALGFGVLLTIVPGGLLISLFSQTVHRKYRKNSELAPYMGRTGSGYMDVLIFTGMFGLPIKVIRWLHKRHPLHYIPDPDALLPHATRYDRVLGFLAYWFFQTFGFICILILITEAIRLMFE